jgi:hypothetical protein
MEIKKRRRRRPTLMIAGESCAKMARRLRRGRRRGVRVDWRVWRKEVAVRM